MILHLPLEQIRAARGIVKLVASKHRGAVLDELQHMEWALTTALSHAEAAQREIAAPEQVQVVQG